MRRSILVVLAAAALAQTGCLRVQPRIPLGDLLPGGERKWEYRQEVRCTTAAQPEVVSQEQTDMLNRMGKDRWELVEIETRDEPDRGRCRIFTFKRPAD